MAKRKRCLECGKARQEELFLRYEDEDPGEEALVCVVCRVRLEIEEQRKAKAREENRVSGEEFLKSLEAAALESDLVSHSVRDKVLDAAKEIINGDRARDYGEARDNFRNIAAGWNVIARQAFSATYFPQLESGHVAMMMAWLKICRLCTDPSHKDSWIDLAGYAALGAEVAGVKPAADEAEELVKENEQ